MPRLVLTFGTLAITASSQRHNDSPSHGWPCNNESAHCLRAPCPAPRPGSSTRCVLQPNPLVVNCAGLCCQERLCDTWDCPSDTYCQCDAAGLACDDGVRAPKSNVFDCGQSADAKKCALGIIHETERSDLYATHCDCLASECRPHVALVKDQPSACVLECRKPETLDAICPNYDDQQDWCSFYAYWECVVHTDSCTTKPAKSTCEAQCDTKVQQVLGVQMEKEPWKSRLYSNRDRLDMFLQCLGVCVTLPAVQMV